MKRCVRNWRIWALAGMLLTAAVLVPVFAARQQGDLTATPYADVIRFEAEGVATLQVRIFDLSGKELWDSGVVSSWVVDWDRRNEWGERLAYGAYLYQAVGWDVDGSVVLERRGKLVLLPGDKVQLQAAPPVSDLAGQDKAPTVPEASPTVQPMGLSDTGIFGEVGIGTTNPQAPLHIWSAGSGSASPGALFARADSGGLTHLQHYYDNISYYAQNLYRAADGIWHSEDSTDYGVAISLVSNASISPNGIAFITTEPSFVGDAAQRVRMVVASDGNVGIGTINPSATLEVHGSATNLLALYDPVAPTDPKFRVEKTGTVRADGAYYSGTGGFHTGYADVAERINTSEWVEPGNVVEIDPEHPGFFRKSSTPYSTKVAGIISTSPGIILGNSFDETTDDWEDNRPVLAVTGRVPCKVTTENGPIEIGDLLVASSTPGIAMKGDPRKAIATVVGKAMEPLKEGEGTIVVQVMLR